MAGVAGMQQVISGHFVMRARDSSFVRNKALVQEKFGETHKQTLGPESKLSELG